MVLDVDSVIQTLHEILQRIAYDNNEHLTIKIFTENSCWIMNTIKLELNWTKAEIVISQSHTTQFSSKFKTNSRRCLMVDSGIYEKLGKSYDYFSYDEWEMRYGYDDEFIFQPSTPSSNQLFLMRQLYVT